ncbi:MAG: VWA domain-containing protein [Theionarchaea archaeon]|nr:VWA domain-containing protein [Theionarchaea archaeon]
MGIKWRGDVFMRIVIISILCLRVMLIVEPLYSQDQAAETHEVQIVSLVLKEEIRGLETPEKRVLAYDDRSGVESFFTYLELQANPVNAVLVLDQSSSMSNKDIQNTTTSLLASRIDVEKRMAREILDSTNDSSQVGLVIFGGDHIDKYGFEENRKNLRHAIDNLEASGIMSKGGKGLSEAIDLCEECERNCMIVVFSDGIEIIGEYDFLTVIGRATQKGIPVFTIRLGTRELSDDLEKIAEYTDGTYYNITSVGGTVDPISKPISDIMKKINEHYLEDVTLKLVEPPGLFIRDASASEGKTPRTTDSTIELGDVSAGKKSTLVIEMGIEKESISSETQVLKPVFSILYRDVFQDEYHNVFLETHTLEIQVETESDYHKRKIYGVIEENALVIAVTLGFLISFVGFLLNRRRTMRRLRNELEYSISQGDLSKNRKDFESALQYFKKAEEISSRLKDGRVDLLSEECSEIERRIQSLSSSRAHVETLVNEISRLVERICSLAALDYVSNSFPEFEILEKGMGSDLRVDRLGDRISKVFESRDPEQIDNLQKDLTSYKKILESLVSEVEKAQDLYSKTRRALETLLRERNLDVERVSRVIEDGSCAHLVLNLAINDHRELESEWNRRLDDELRDEKAALLEARKLIKAGKFERAESLLGKALTMDHIDDIPGLYAEITTALDECKRLHDDTRDQLTCAYNEAMQAYQSKRFEEAEGKFRQAQTLAEMMDESTWIEKAESMTHVCSHELLCIEQEKAIIRKMKEENGIAAIEWLARYVEAYDIGELLTRIRKKYNIPGEDEQYRVYPYEDIPVFIDFHALSRYVFDHPGEIAGKIPPNNLEIPIDLQKELLNVMESFRRGEND